jgi:hypothetical protein
LPRRWWPASPSFRGLIDPQQASLRFGFPVSDAAGALFYRVYLSRNLVIVAASAVFLIRRQWTPLAVLLTAAAVLPVFDMTVLSFDGVAPPAFHRLALALLAIAAALLWRLSHTSKSWVNHSRRKPLTSRPSATAGSPRPTTWKIG